ncbi:DUF1156 domain-containing protein [Pistricoccus aurantiacus]|uniref:DUF1156 domain-containing protein n=1 Tax=Pistricoccus aurantiacus TaxID=1883414 RepID=A0A5B8SVE9_9GAMM|nr:DUF1156 domain-containing protein [Pistricoccus aurantiacus]QEA38670.1 DUF1156 domain-containing protein [Pistricoccus aurantiacus]
MDFSNDQRLIEAGFPCHQVGAETQRERGASSALPPLYYLHVWWARRPLTPSRAAILASLLPAGSSPSQFIQKLGIEVLCVNFSGSEWVLDDAGLLARVEEHTDGEMSLIVDRYVYNRHQKEKERRGKHRCLLEEKMQADPSLRQDEVVKHWYHECADLPDISMGMSLPVIRKPGDPAWAKERIDLESRLKIRTQEDKYKYPRAYSHAVTPDMQGFTVLDPTSGGGSIPFEALRLGCKVVANEINPVASVILKATLDYPVRFGEELADHIKLWGDQLSKSVNDRLAQFYPATKFSPENLSFPSGLHDFEVDKLCEEKLDGFLFCRQVICPHCNGEAPLLNSFWLSKSGEKWAVKIKPQSDKTVRFDPICLSSEGVSISANDLDAGTVSRGVGQCVHCHQAISGDEIKRQARGESELGQWQDTLYCVVGVRRVAKLEKNGKPARYTSGERKGELKTSKYRYFRAPNQSDLEALKAAAEELEERRLDFEMKGLVPNESFPPGNDMRPVNYGMPTWADMFTPRQLLGHLTVMDALQDAKPKILAELGEEKGKAVVTYLQFATDKVVDYNSRQNRWIPQRGTISGTFSRHDFSLKWTFGEMAYTGASSGIRWGVSQAVDAYEGIEELVRERGREGLKSGDLLQVQGSATDMSSVDDASVDAVVMDPPYYDNVQYSELSDFYYVWQKKTLGDLYPGWFDHEVTDKALEAVANPARDGSAKGAKARYEELMQGIFAESKRVLKPEGIMTLMFTHKSSDAWETLTNSLIQSGWDITATYPVDSEFGASTHQLNLAAAASTIFIACRPSDRGDREPSSWAYEVKGKLEAAVREGLGEFERLKLNPVDRMIASWGRALRVYSAHWPVQDGDEDVPPTRAMQEAARVVAEEEVSRLSGGLVTVDDLDAESRLAVIALGINGLGDFAFDDALQMSRSLNFRLQNRNGNYRVSDDMVAYANVGEDERAAPLAIKGNKLRLLKPEERAAARLENPQTLWDVLGGLIVTYRDGGIVAARNFLTQHGKRDSDALRGLLKVWAKECRDDELKREAQLIDYEL